MHRHFLVVMAILGLPVLAYGDTMYVTDNLQLGLHKLEDTSDRPFKTLDSGQQLEVIERSRNYAKVRVPDGTEGYVKFAYLVTDKPAKLIVQETQAARDALAKQLADTRAAYADPAARIDSLQAELLASRETAEQAVARNAELLAENEDHRQHNEMYKYKLPWQWVLGASIVCLLIGFIGALWLVDSRNRKRHGGIRIY